MYVINDVSLSNVNTMLNKNLVQCMDDTPLELEYNLIEDLVQVKQNTNSPLNNNNNNNNNKKYSARKFSYKIKP
jgi:hypothetical protein